MCSRRRCKGVGGWVGEGGAPRRCSPPRPPRTPRAAGTCTPPPARPPRAPRQRVRRPLSLSLPLPPPPLPSSLTSSRLSPMWALNRTGPVPLARGKRLRRAGRRGQAGGAGGKGGGAGAWWPGTVLFMMTLVPSVEKRLICRRRRRRHRRRPRGARPLPRFALRRGGSLDEGTGCCC